MEIKLNLSLNADGSHKALLSNLLQRGILFGSRAWHCNTYTSDFDIIVTLKDSRLIRNWLSKNNIRVDMIGGISQNKSSRILMNSENYKFTLDSVVYNIIAYEEALMPKVTAAVEHITLMVGINSPISTLFKSNKKYRIKIVEAIMVPYLKGITSTDMSIKLVKSFPFKYE